MAPPVDINSPGEPRFVTFYQALESASIRNENLGTDEVPQQRQTLTGGVTKVDSNASVPNGASNDTANNNDTATSPNATITTTSSPVTTVDTTTTAIQPANGSLSSRLGTENTPNGTPETASTTVETPANPDPSGNTTPSSVNMNNTTSAPTSEPPGIYNTITIHANVFDKEANIKHETVTTLTSTSVDSTATTEIAPITGANTDVPMPASQNLSTNMSGMTTLPSSPESITMPPAMTTLPTMNDDNETNAAQQFNGTTLNRTTDAPLNISENVVARTESNLTMFQVMDNSTTTEVNNILDDLQQLNTTVPSQMTEATSAAELTTTEEISNDITQARTTQAPITTSTFNRGRIIDFAQDILSRLQNDLSTTEASSQIPITTFSFDLYNTIPDSSSNNESPAGTQETTTVQEAGSGNVETTSQMNVETTTGRNNESIVQTTTTATDGSAQEMTSHNTTVGLDTPGPSVEQRLSSNVNVERNATLNSDSMMTTAQDTRNLGDSSIDAEVATTTPSSRFVDFVTENDPSSNDTLLTELMSIAKSLFSEAMNDTRQSSFVPSQISDFEATTLSDVSNLSRVNGRIKSDNKNPVTSPSDTSEKTTASSALPTSLESIIEHRNLAMSIDLPGNEAESNSNHGSMVGSGILNFNERPTDVESPVDVGDVTAIPQMSLSQIGIETTNTIMPASMNFQLTTNTPNSQLSNPTESIDNNTEQQNISITNFAQNESTTLLNNNLGFAIMDFTNDPSVMNSSTANAAEMFANLNESTNMSVETGLTTSVAIPEINVIQMNDTNQTTGTTRTKPVSDPTNDRFLVMNALGITTVTSDDTTTDMSNTSDTQAFSTEPSLTESLRNLLSSIETTTNQLNDITTNAPQTIVNPVNETSNLIARFQDTTTATTTTAQGTAGSSIIQPTQTTETTTIPTTTAPTSTSSPTSSASPIYPIMTTTSSMPTTTANATTTETTTTTMTTTTTGTPQTTPVTLSSHADFTTSTIDINENLVSTEASTTDSPTTRGTTIPPNEADDLNMISRMDVGQDMPMTTTTMSTTASTTAAPMNASTTPTTTTSTTQAAMNATMRPTFTPANLFNSVPYFGRLGANQIMTPTSRLSSFKAPVRDYLIYGIYPNKTIVRKRPEDNLIDPRNVDSPYVIFGIYPDGRLVRKFPNGTIIPDSPRNPVEVVFTLSTTTTTNRPAPRPFYNQANQAGTYNQYQAPVYSNNRRPVDELTANGQNPSPIDLGLIGNAIGVPPGVGPIFAGPFGPPASVPSTNKMVSLSTLFMKILLYPRNELDREAFS